VGMTMSSEAGSVLAPRSRLSLRLKLFPVGPGCLSPIYANPKSLRRPLVSVDKTTL
jgi:hypothetical protein